MPKKSRTPPPPRRVQAPRRREEPKGPWLTSRSTLIGAAVVLGVGAVIGLGVGLAGRGGGSPAKKLAAAGCTFETLPDLGAQHVQSLDAKVKYNSFPPTSGSHYVQPAVWGSYTKPLNLVQEVHNLEHGGVIIQYGSNVPHLTVAALKGFYDESPNGMLLAPLPRLGKKIALTAWTHLANCTRFDRAALRSFRGTYRGKGPERIPVSTLQPGT